MTQPKFLVPTEDADRTAPLRNETHALWRVLGALGVIFFLVGGIDAALVWVPANFGLVEWEFGSITAGLNGLPLPVLGLGLMLVQALAEGRQVAAKVLIAVLLLLAVVIAAAGVLFATDVPIALRAVQSSSVAELGLKKSIVKTAVQLFAYPVGLGVVSWRSWRMTEGRI